MRMHRSSTAGISRRDFSRFLALSGSVLLPQQPEDDLELDREMEYLIEPEEALGGGGTIE